MSNISYADAAPAQVGRPRRFRRLIGRGLLATVVAVAANAAGAALARAAGADFVIPDGGEIPVSGIATVTGLFSIIGVVMAAAFLHWSARPANRFRWTALVLTAVSLVPPLLSGAEPTTVASLIGLHLIAATVMIPVLTRGLRVHR